jgi:peptidoglycan/xylan/chitin deacetylase (PgdA/CDA1 family)
MGLFRWTFLLLVGIPYYLFWPGAVLPMLEKSMPGCVWRGDPQINAVALTFDDGPDPVYTPQVLEILDRWNIKAAFFLVGERARLFPDLVEEIRQRGHEIGNHTDSWDRTIGVGATRIERDLLEAHRTLALGSGPKYFRPAGGMLRPSHLKVLKKHGYTCVLASAIPFDSYRPPAGWIKALVNRSLRPGAIVVLHDSGGDRSRTVAALPGIIEEAHERGLAIVTLSELLKPVP